MAEHEQPKVDSVTGVSTTGHEWDGIAELNNPLPRWWLWIFYACIAFAAGYWVLYPSWPLITNAAGGVFGWHARTAVVDDLAALKAQRAPMVAKLAGVPIDQVKADAGLFDFTLAYGRAAFGDNCAPCHGPGGGGAKGYPNLIDDDSGVGRQIGLGDLNGDGRPDIIIGNKKGAFVFTNQATTVSRAEWEKAQPKVLYPDAEKNSLTAKDVIVHTPRASDVEKAKAAEKGKGGK